MICGLVLGIYYLTVFRPLAHRAATLDRPLVTDWNRLMATNRASTATEGLDLENCQQRLLDLKQQATNLETAERLVGGRLQLPPAVQRRMTAPFQLIDYQNERLARIAQLMTAAKAKGTTLAPSSTNGLPEFVVDVPQPAMLWPRLALAYQLLLTAVECQVGTIQALYQLPHIPHTAGPDRSRVLYEMPMQLELIGDMHAVSRFLATLPLRPDELAVVGLATTLTNKPPLFIRQILLRKHSPEHPHEVDLQLTVSGFVTAPQDVTSVDRDDP